MTVKLKLHLPVNGKNPKIHSFQLKLNNAFCRLNKKRPKEFVLAMTKYRFGNNLGKLIEKINQAEQKGGK
jgi:hypothetical protein